MKMVLAGIVVSSLFNALLAILKYLADPMDQLPGIVFWLMGGFSRAGWQEVRLVLPFCSSWIDNNILFSLASKCHVDGRRRSIVPGD